MTSARRILPLGLVSALSSVPAAGASYFYALGTNNHLYEVSDSGVQRDVRDLSGLGGTGLVNGAAFDSGRSQFFFAVPGATSGDQASLWYWNQATNATPVSLGLLPTATPDNGAYWNGAYWYIRQGTHTLHRVALDQTGSTPSLAVGGASTATLTGSVPSTGSNFFGDIVITSVGTLYATTASGDSFYTLALPSVALSGSLIVTSPGNVGGGIDKVQLSLDASGTTIFGHAYDSGQWYTVATTGALTPLVGFTSFTVGSSPVKGFQDMGGAAATATPSAGVPERGPWLALLSVTLFSLFLVRRRR
jgi:hypothetical protein